MSLTSENAHKAEIIAQSCNHCTIVGQSYNTYTLVNYDSRVETGNFLVSMTLQL